MVGAFQLQSLYEIFTFTYPVVWWTVGAPQTSRLSAFLMTAPSVMPVHSEMLSSHIFFCLPLLVHPCTCRIVLASPVDLVTCPYHFSLRRFSVVKRSSWGPVACRVLFPNSSLEMWSLLLYEIALRYSNETLRS